MTLSPIFRLSVSIALMAASLVFLAEMIGLVPDTRAAALEARRKTCESLAVQLSIAATRSDIDLVKQTLDVFASRNPEVRSAAMRRANGEVLSQTAEHEKHWAPILDDRSTSTQVLVPIFAGEERWGSVEVSFAPLDHGVAAWLRDTSWGLALFLAVVGLMAFYVILRRALRQLDPRGTIPSHIKSAFDALAEGVLILDHRGLIVLANAAFANKVGRSPSDLIGAEAARFGWRDTAMKKLKSDTLPWKRTLSDGEAQARVVLRLAPSGEESDPQIFVTNSAPISDGSDRPRGVIVTFDDITALEKKNEELKNTIDLLHESERELMKLACRDPLTDCLNRRAFFDAYEPLSTLVEKQGMELSCLMVDIDHFKSINDRFGHDMGDKVIKWVAETIHANVNSEDLVCRYGGEEFCVVLPNSGLFQAHGIAQQIRRAIEENASVRFGRELPVTISVGMTSAQPGAATTAANLITQADKALYVAKSSGRNRVVRWSPDTTEGVELQPTVRQHARSNEEDITVETVDAVSVQAVASQTTQPPAGGWTPRLAERVQLVERIEKALEASRRSDRGVAVLSIVPNQFRRISDTLGPAVGDAVLNVIGQRLHATLCGSDAVPKSFAGKPEPLVSRLGLDELGILLAGVRTKKDVDKTISAVFRSLSQPLEIGGHVVEIGVSIGVALTPEGGSTPEALLKNAAAARHYAQERNHNERCEFYSMEMSAMSMRRMRIVGELQHALDNNQLVLNFQPQKDLQTDDIVSWEALLRWNHPELGPIDPSEIIPIAEQTGLIHSVGKWVLRTACLHAKVWSDSGFGEQRVAVNLSPVQLQQSDIVAQVREVLAQTGLEPHRLELEITESAIMHDQQLAQRMLRQLKEIGIRIAIDDFGIGYSGLSYIKDFPVDVVKVDRSFLTNVLTDPRASKLYSGIVDMARRLNLYVVAEGVESTDVLDFVGGLGCDAVQGYLVSAPVPASDVSRVLQEKGGVDVEEVKYLLPGSRRYSFGSTATH